MKANPPNSSETKPSGGMTDLARKILLTGVGAIFMTEETIRKTLSDWKVPSEAVGSLVESMKKQKDEVLRVVASQLSDFFSHVKVHEEIQKALQGIQLHLDAKISFNKKNHPSHAKLTVRKREPK